LVRFGGKDSLSYLETQIILRTNKERRLFQQLKDREFPHTKVYDNTLLNETGMIREFGAASMPWAGELLACMRRGLKITHLRIPLNSEC
jgi:hypothetical protein